MVKVGADLKKTKRSLLNGIAKLLMRVVSLLCIILPDIMKMVRADLKKTKRSLLNGIAKPLMRVMRVL